MRETRVGIRTPGLLVAALLGVASLAAGARVAQALGESPPAEIVSRAVEGKRSQQELSREAVEVALQSSTVRDLRLRSEIEDASGALVEAGEVARSVLARNPGISLRPGVIVARQGDVVSLPRPHKLALAAGVYSETVRIAVTDAAYSAPLVISRVRFFRIGTDGAVETISSEAYSHVVDGPGRAARDRDGVAIVVQEGRGFGRNSDKGRKPALPSLTPDGRIENLDAEVKLPPPRTEAGDERHEQ